MYVMSEPRIVVGAELPPFERTTGLANWNRYAAVNDEFIDVHMDDEAARAIGMPGVFGMGNLRISYLHNLLVEALGSRGDVVEFRCEFRGLNLKGDRLRCTAAVEDVREDGGRTLADLRLGVVNQDGVDTTPGSATVVLFGDRPSMPPEGPRREPSGAARPGTFLTEATIERIGREMEPVAAPPVGANDIGRWATATWWPEPPPAVFVDPAAAAADGPWGELVAPRDFDPFAWMPERPWSGDWLWGMGSGPGERVLNGGQVNRYGEPVRPGDVISVTRRFVDVVERETTRGPMVFFTSEFRWTNQRGEMVRVGEQTTIYW
jgi:acyl dehydratase